MVVLNSGQSPVQARAGSGSAVRGTAATPWPGKLGLPDLTFGLLGSGSGGAEERLAGAGYSGSSSYGSSSVGSYSGGCCSCGGGGNLGLGNLSNILLLLAGLALTALFINGNLVFMGGRSLRRKKKLLTDTNETFSIYSGRKFSCKELS